MLSAQQINIIIDTMKPYNPTKIGIFGSVARGENSAQSDIDILYDFDYAKFTLFDLAGIQAKLEKALGKGVDLVDFSALKPRFKRYISPDIKMIYGG